METSQGVPQGEGRKEDLRTLLRWLILAPLLLVFTSCCATLGTVRTAAKPDVDIASQLEADYAPWAEVAFAPLDPAILADIARDLGLLGTPGVPLSSICFLPGPGCSPGGIPSPTPSATPTLTPTTVPTGAQTPTATPTLRSLLPTNTPTRTPIIHTPTNTPTPTPLVYPVKVGNPVNIPPGAASVQFTILVINFGSIPPAQLTDVIDTLPANMTYQPGSCNPGGCAAAGNTVSWSVSVNIPQGSFERFSFIADVAGTSAGDVLTNHVETRGGNFDTAVNVRRIYVHTPTPPGSIPVAVGDSYSINEDNVLGVAAPGVLSNDTDPGGDPLHARLILGPATGVLSLNADGSFTYTPNPNYWGSVAFTYQACDSGYDGIAGNGDDFCSGPATVDITVVSIPDTPVAADDSYTVLEDGSLNVVAPGVLGNDTDGDGDLLTASLITGPANAAPVGFTFNSNGSFSYAPALDFFGSDLFTYQACDPSARCDTATAFIAVTAVNDAPVAVDDSASTSEDLSVSIPVVMGGALGGTDTDVDNPNSDLRVASITAVNGGTAVLLTGGRMVLFTPLANANDLNRPAGFSFQYRVQDLALSSTNLATVTISVAPVNDVPVGVADLTYTTGQGVALNVAAPGVLANDSDADVEPLTASLLTQPTSQGSYPGTSLTLNADGSFDYSPDPLFHGADTFTYQACDPVPTCSPATTVQVLVNDAPIGVPEAYAMDEDEPGGLVVPAPGVLANDSDPNGDPLTAALWGGAVNGSVALGANGGFTFVPTLDFNGVASFTYRAADPWTFSAVTTVTINVAPVNDRPVAVDDGRAEGAFTESGMPVEIFVLANDSDPDGDSLIVGSVTPPLHGSVVNNGSSVTYTPVGWVGNDTFTYQACDPEPLCNGATVTVVVNGGPVANDDSYNAIEDTQLNVPPLGVLSNDFDVNGDTLQALLDVGPLHAASFTLNLDGSFSYRPSQDYEGTDQFIYQACDPSAQCDSATVTIIVAPVSDPPAAVDDVVTTPEDVAITIDVMANDSDPDGDPLTITWADDPPNGTATIDDKGTPNPADDEIVYDPDFNFFGTDTFDYTIDDGNGGNDTATVTVTVTPVNDAPHANDDSYALSGPGPFQIFAGAGGVLDNDVEYEGQALNAVWVSDPANALSFTLFADGSFAYDPLPGFHGTDPFTYQACDPTPLCDTATATIAVNESPQAVDDSGYIVAEDGALMGALPSLLANDTDSDGDPLQALPLPSGGDPSYGSVIIYVDGTFDYIPDPDYNGPDTFRYRACDPYSACDAATVSLTVTPVNDAPVANDDAEPPAVYRPNAGQAFGVAAPGVLANDIDVDGDALQAVLLAGPANGVLTLNPDGSFTYTANAAFSGTDSFTYQASDATVPSNVATVTLEVNGWPVALDDGYSVDEDTPLTVTAPGVLGNDSDPDVPPDSLAASLLLGTQGLTLNPDGSLTYNPPLNSNGTVTFTYEACDPGGLCDPATGTITVNPVNDAPVAVADTFRTNMDTPLSLTVLANDTDVDGGPLTIIGVTDPPNGTAVINGNVIDYAPDPGYYSNPAPDSFTYTISDGNGGFDTGTIQVTVNGPPSAAGDAYVLDEDVPLNVPASGVLANDTDPNGDTLNAVQVAGAGKGPDYGSVSLNPDGSFTYTPAPNYNGPDFFTYQACDGDGLCSGEATVDLTVNPVNDPPVAGADSYGPIDEDDPAGLVVAAPGLLANDSDPVEGDSIQVDPTPVAPPANGSVTLNLDGSFAYHPNANFCGNDSFTYRVFDTDYSPPAAVTVQVTCINDPPVAANDSGSTNQGSSVTVNVVANDTDIDGTVVASSAVLVGGAANGSVVNNGNGTFTYTPSIGAFTSDSFTYQVADNNGALSNVATVNITINPPVVRVVKEVTPTTASVGDTVDFIIYVWNDGPGTAFGLTLTDTLGSCFVWVSGNPSGALGDLPAGGAVVRLATARVVGSGSCSDVNAVSVSSLNAGTLNTSVSVTIVP